MLTTYALTMIALSLLAGYFSSRDYTRGIQYNLEDRDSFKNVIFPNETLATW